MPPESIPDIWDPATELLKLDGIFLRWWLWQWIQAVSPSWTLMD
jgi:hypothetical protein|nr:hypothetical protein [Leptospirillum ferrooxidans]